MSELATTENGCDHSQLPIDTHEATPVPRNRLYEDLVRRIQLSSNGDSPYGPRAVGFTSTKSGEGVTTVAVNTAISATRVIAGKILLVDANREDAQLQNVFCIDPDVGLLNAMAGERQPLDCIADTPIENLSLLPAGRIAAGQSASFDRDSVAELIDTLQHVFTLILFDLPPINRFTAAGELAGQLDGLLLVVEAGRATRDDTRRACRQLANAGADVLGAVYNKTSTTQRF